MVPLRQNRASRSARGLASTGTATGRPRPVCTAVEPLERRTFLSAAVNGLDATYYNTMTLTDPVLERVDPQVNFYWGTKGPGDGVPATHFSAQWVGEVLAPKTQTYTFITTSDDGIRVWVDSKEIIDDWTAHAAKVDTATIALDAGVKYPIKIEYFQDVASATCVLEWSAATIAKEVVPSADLFPTPAATPTPTPTPTPTTPTPTTPEPPIPGKWHMAFDDEFNTLNTNVWTNGEYWYDDNLGTQASFETSNVSVANGILSITANKQAAKSDDGTATPYTSGLLQSGGIAGKTKPGFSFTYGYVEMRTKIAPGQGMWSAFWMQPVSHQDNYELDIFENLGRAPTTFQGYDHDWPNFGYEASYPTGFDMTAGWHTYGVDWEPNSVTWYVDGKAVATYTNASVVPNQPMYLIMNLDVGGNWAGPLTAASPDQSTWEIDYVRVWQH